MKKINSVPLDTQLIPTRLPPTPPSLILSKWGSVSCEDSDSSGDRMSLKVPKANNEHSHPLPKPPSPGEDMVVPMLNGGSEPRGRGNVFTRMIQRKRAPAPTDPTPPGGELRFHRTNKKISEGALGDHPRMLLLLWSSLPLYECCADTRGWAQAGSTKPPPPLAGTAGSAPSLKTAPVQPERWQLQRGGALLAQNIPNGE